MSRVMFVWCKRCQWINGVLNVRVMRLSATVYRHLPKTPVGPHLGNSWVEPTDWWRHLEGWRFQWRRIIMYAKQVGSAITKPFTHPVIGWVMTIIAAIIAGYILHRLGWV